MIGDQTDMLQRLRLTLPGRWFGDVAPVLNGLLSGFASAWANLHTLLLYVVTQSRVETATETFLDLAAQDFLSDGFPRRSNEADADYRRRLLMAMRRVRGTSPAIVAAADAAGYTLHIFEPAQPASTGAYNVSAGLAWNTVGGWGSMQMPLESLLVASPGSVAFEGELWRNVSHAAPAGGALWMRVAAAS